MVSVVIKCGSGNRMKFFIGLVCYICPRVSFCLGKGPSIKHINLICNMPKFIPQVHVGIGSLPR